MSEVIKSRFKEIGVDLPVVPSATFYAVTYIYPTHIAAGTNPQWSVPIFYNTRNEALVAAKDIPEDQVRIYELKVPSVELDREAKGE